MTLDHVQAKARNGAPASWENLVTCCGPCNHSKGADAPGAWPRFSIAACRRLAAAQGTLPEMTEAEARLVAHMPDAQFWGRARMC